jgi:hypothetical protein
LKQKDVSEILGAGVQTFQEECVKMKMVGCEGIEQILHLDIRDIARREMTILHASSERSL